MTRRLLTRHAMMVKSRLRPRVTALEAVSSCEMLKPLATQEPPTWYYFHLVVLGDGFEVFVVPAGGGAFDGEKAWRGLVDDAVTDGGGFSHGVMQCRG